jgi:hypothetical protein
LSVIKEPEVPEGWLTGRDVFELERRALFSQVSMAPCQLSRASTNKRLTVLGISCPSHPTHKARCISVIRSRWLPRLFDPRKRQPNPRVPQRLPSSCLYNYPKGDWCINCSRLSISWMEL